MINKSLPLVVLALLAAGSLHLRAEQKKVKPAASQKSPVILLKCPDIAVHNMQVTLVNTLLGDLQVEFPMDTVKLEATLENVGSAAVPPGALLYVILKKNGEAIQSAIATDALGAPGSRWTYSVNDSFTHGQKTTYVIQAASAFRECRVSNNQATRTIDEKKLHPAGNPDLTVSIFAIEKRWEQEGNRFQAAFDLAAEVANGGSGYSDSASRLLFVLNNDKVLATLNISQDELPGPGQKKRFSAGLAAAQVPLGEFLVSAHIEPARNEYVRNNNWSLNNGQISNSADPPSGVLAVLEFQSWHLAGNKLSATMQMTSLQNQYLRNMRLLLLKNNVRVKEWKTSGFVSQASSQVRYVEERQPPPVKFGIDRYRAILTSDLGKPLPADNTILDSRTRNLYWLEMSEGFLQNNLQDKDNGLAINVYRQNKYFRIKETLAKISPAGICISVKGKKIVDNFPGMEFHAEIHLNPRLVLGQVKLDVTKTVVRLGSGLSGFFGSLLAPILCQSIKAVIEKFAAKELAANMSGAAAAPGNLNSQLGAPIGIILIQGALDLYY
jgi:hypothetical protein